MSRQPLLRSKYREAKPTFGPRSLDERHAAAILIAKIVVLNSEIDAATALTLGRMVGANTLPVMALFLALRQSRMQFQTLDAVAKPTLSEREYEIFEALMSRRSSADKERDALAHGRFGTTNRPITLENIPPIANAIFWVNSFDYLQYETRLRTEGISNEAIQWLAERTYVYELSNLTRILDDATVTHDLLLDFLACLDAAPESALRRQLLH